MFWVMSWPQKVAVLLAAALPAMWVAGFVALLLVILGRPWRALTMVVPSVVLSATVLLLVENFTKTIAGFNMGSFRSPARYLYALGFVLLIVLFNSRLRRLVDSEAFSRWRRVMTVGLVGAVAMTAIAAGIRYQPERSSEAIARESEDGLANVLILSSDGINANQMSAYGYERETTPFLDSRLDQFLVSENHLTNAAYTAGSIGALLTGKLPTTTGVTQQFHVFRGRDAYEHLPGLLRQLGYYGIEIGERHYADSRDQNLQRAFHVSNSHTLAAANIALVSWYGRLFPSEQYFFGSTLERIRERIAHAFGIADMPEALLARSKHQPEWTSDELRISALKRQIGQAPRPFFAHVHLLNSHGPRFRIGRAHFSAGREQTKDLDQDFRDDATLGFDDYIGEMVRYLEEIGELDNTLLIINTDHGNMGMRNSERLPLLIRFPRSEHRGRISANTQRIDIAPTILSYLGVRPPEWMEGQSLLDSEIDRLRLIFSTDKSRSPSQTALAVVQCQQWFQLHPETGVLEEKTLRGHTDPCPENELISGEEGRRFILAQLSESQHFVEPLLMGRRLAELRTESDPAMRRQLARAIRDRLTLVRRLDDEMVVTRAHWDLWTYSTSPAGLLVINEGDQPLTRRLVVQSGQEREFPFSFHVEDGSETRDYSFERRGAITVQLAPVPPGSERLYIIWSDQVIEKGRRRLGVKLSVGFGDKLEKLQRTADSEERQRLAEAILSGEIESRRLSDDLLVAGAHWDAWTRGDRPAALVVRNRGGRALVARLAVHSGEGREFPVTFYVEDGESTQQYIFTKPGSSRVELAPVRPRAERLFVVWTDQPWTPDSPDRRVLGIKLSPADDDRE
jgi:arylsulfatase A-like enzyme